MNRQILEKPFSPEQIKQREGTGFPDIPLSMPHSSENSGRF